MNAGEPRIGVIIAAGGTGSRFGRVDGKQLALLEGQAVVAWALRPFLELDGLIDAVVVCHPDRREEYKAHLTPAASRSGGVTPNVVAGGESRQESVARGLDALSEETDLVIVHDGARPLVSRAVVQRTVQALLAADGVSGAVVGHPSVDTLKRIEQVEGFVRVVETPDRSQYWAVQTPQVFRAGALRAAYRSAKEAGFVGTDDASLVERLGGVVILVEGPADNIKVTHAEDLAIAEAVLRSRAEEAGA